jgi:hypothetical protein
VTRSVLESLGGDIDKEDRAVGWIVTDSRRLDGDHLGVSAKSITHRPRMPIERLDETHGRSVAKRILDEIGRSR